MTRPVFTVLLTLLLAGWMVSADEKDAAGKKIKPLMLLEGRKSKIEEPSFHRITNDAEWEKLWAAHKTGSPDLKGLQTGLDTVELDFDHVMVIAVFDGVRREPGGIFLYSIRETDDQILIDLATYGNQGLFDGITKDSFRDSLAEKEAAVNCDWRVIVLPRTTRQITITLKPRDADSPKELKRFPAISR